MKIVDIFAYKLFSFHFEGESMSELRKIMTQWYDMSYIYGFLKNHSKDLPKNHNIQSLAKKINYDAKKIDETLERICESNDQNLSEFFKPLNNEEYVFQLLSKQKGRENFLRIYAIRISDDCYVVTGGAIKLTRLMQEREHTTKELNRLDRCRDFLKGNAIVDEESFFEFLIEEQENDE